MKITAAYIEPYALRFARPLRTARGAFVERRGFVLRLCDAHARVGLGDAAAWPGFGSGAEYLSLMAASLCERLRGVAVSDKHALPGWLHRLALPPELTYAVELACLDLLAQESGVSIARLLAEEAPRQSVACHALVNQAVDAQNAVRAGATAIKVKLGMLPLADDVVRVGAMRAAIGPDVGLRLDVNGAWDVEKASRAVRMLTAYTPEWVEQPVADVDGLARVRDGSPIRIAADESVSGMADLERVIAARAADVVVLKPMFAGGLLQTMALAARAHGAGLGLCITHALESAIGRMGTLHVCAALPQPLGPCGLGNPLAVDLGRGPEVAGGHCRVPQSAGLGVTYQGVTA